jgi:hypothetical protein
MGTGICTAINDAVSFTFVSNDTDEAMHTLDTSEASQHEAAPSTRQDSAPAAPAGSSSPEPGPVDDTAGMSSTNGTSSAGNSGPNSSSASTPAPAPSADDGPAEGGVCGGTKPNPDDKPNPEGERPGDDSGSPRGPSASVYRPSPDSIGGGGPGGFVGAFAASIRA